MAFTSSCFAHPQISLKIDCGGLVAVHQCKITLDTRMAHSFQGLRTQVFGLKNSIERAELRSGWSFLRGHRFSLTSVSKKVVPLNKKSAICCSWFTIPQIANSAFTLGTAAVLPFYTLMVVAPKSELTKRSMESSIPYVVLGLLYAYLLYLSWTPETIRLMFASQYWLPELPGIAKMFASETTLASAWIHLLAVDLFAARQIYRDGLDNEIETRHSVSLCLLFCPVGILTHVITKALTQGEGGTRHII